MDKEMEIYPINHDDGYTVKEFDFYRAYIMTEDIMFLLYYYDDTDSKDIESKELIIQELKRKCGQLGEYIYNFIS